MIRAASLAAWEFFQGLGLSGLSLDLACGTALAVALMAAVPLVGRGVGAIMDCAMKGIAQVAGRRTALFLANYATFPGVILHELSHAVGAKLSGAKLDRVSLFEPNGETLGTVEFTCRGKRRRNIAFQKAVSSCAPVIGGIVMVSVFMSVSRWGDGYPALQAMSAHGAFSMACHTDMSRQDMKNYVGGCMWLLPYMAMAMTVIAYYFGHSA